MPLPRTINRNPDFLHVDAVTGPDRTLAIPTRVIVKMLGPSSRDVHPGPSLDGPCLERL